MSVGMCAGADPRTVHVTTVGGGDSNSGITSAVPLATLAEAGKRLRSVGGGTIVVVAPVGNPITTPIVWTDTWPVSIEGLDGATWYVDVTGAGLSTSGALTITDAHITGTTFGVDVSGGSLTAVDCYAEGGTTGWRTLNAAALVATGCTGLGGTNDGWNLNGTSVSTLTDCIGDDCGDEGVSPHVSAVLNIVGGHYNRNGSAGMAAVADSVCNISGGAVFDDNGQIETSFGGCFYYEQASGVINEATFTNNSGPGVSISGTTGTVTLTAYTSTGNGLPDDLT